MLPQQPWQKAIVALAATCLAAFITAAMYFGRSVFIPIALAIFFSFVLSPVVSRLQRYRVPRVPAVLLATVLALGGFGGMMWMMGSQMSALADRLPLEKERVTARLKDLRERVMGSGENKFAGMVNDVEKVLDPEKEKKATVGVAEPTRVILEPQGTSLFNRMDTFISPAAEIVGQGAFTLVLAVFILLKREDLRNRFLRLVGSGRVTTTTKAVDDASKRVSRFLLAQLLLNTGFAIVCGIGLWLLDVDYALLWAAFAFLMRYIPFIGTWLGVIPPAIFSLATSEQPWVPLAVLALFLGLEAFCNNVLEPRLYGRSLGVSEVAQLVSVGVWAFMWGPIGLVLSQPLTTCLLVLGKYVPALKFLDILLGDEPVLEPKVVFYQRLAARDQDEAATVAEQEVAKGRTVAEVYDDLFVPALTNARTDMESGELTADELTHLLAVLKETGEEVADEAAKKLTVPLEPFEGARVRVLGCPAKDATDRAAVELFGHLLDTTRWEYQTTAVETLTSETMTRIEDFDPMVVVLGSVPPGGVTHTKYMCKRLRARFPNIKIVVGRWGGGDGQTDAGKLLLAAGADRVDDSLTDTRQDLNGWLTVLAGKDTPANGVPAVGTERAVVPA